MLRNLVGLYICLVAAIVSSGCGKTGDHQAVSASHGGNLTMDDKNLSSGAVTYAANIQALFQSRCSACHNSGSTIPNWLDYSSAFAKRDKIYQRVVVAKDMPIAPFNAAMTEGDRAMVAAWINAGAPLGTVGPGTNPGPVPNPGPNPGPVPNPTPPTGFNAPIFADVKPIFLKRCTICHNREDAAVPNWLIFDYAYRFRSQIYRYTVAGDQMPPFKNMTGMTAAERQTLGAWIKAGAQSGDLAPLLPNSPVTYAKDVLPIFIQRCGACHNANGDPKVPNWFDYKTTVAFAKKIVQRVTVDRNMPPGNITKITWEEKQRLKLWVDQGAR